MNPLVQIKIGQHVFTKIKKRLTYPKSRTSISYNLSTVTFGWSPQESIHQIWECRILEWLNWGVLLYRTPKKSKGGHQSCFTVSLIQFLSPFTLISHLKYIDLRILYESLTYLIFLHFLWLWLFQCFNYQLY